MNFLNAFSFAAALLLAISSVQAAPQPEPEPKPVLDFLLQVLKDVSIYIRMYYKSIYIHMYHNHEFLNVNVTTLVYLGPVSVFRTITCIRFVSIECLWIQNKQFVVK